MTAFDWNSNDNDGHDDWRFEFSNTAPERVATHAVNQHEAPGFDADTETLLLAHGTGTRGLTRDPRAGGSGTLRTHSGRPWRTPSM